MAQASSMATLSNYYAAVNSQKPFNAFLLPPAKSSTVSSPPNASMVKNNIVKTPSTPVSAPPTVTSPQASASYPADTTYTPPSTIKPQANAAPDPSTYGVGEATGNSPAGTPVGNNGDISAGNGSIIPVGSPAALYQKYGLQPPSNVPNYGDTGTNNPTVDKANADVSAATPSYFTDQASRDKLLSDSLAAIKAKYDSAREQATYQTENERKASLAGYYGLGVVNPLGSGNTSIDNSSGESLTRRLNAIGAEQAAEELAVRSKVYGLTTDAQDKALAAAQANRTAVEGQVKTAFTNSQQSFQDAWTNVNNIMGLWKNNQEISKDQQATAQTAITSLLANFGPRGLPLNADDQAALEKAAGYKPGAISRALGILRTKEMLGTLNLKQMDNGNLVNIGVDKNGNPSAELLVPGGLGGVGNLQFQREEAYRAKRDSDPLLANFPQVQASYQSALAAANNPNKNGPNDLAFLYNVARVTNPGMAVKASEFNNFDSAQGYLQQLGVKFDPKTWLNGGVLSDSARQAFKNLLDVNYTIAYQQYMSRASQLAQQASRDGIDPTNVIYQYTPTMLSGQNAGGNIPYSPSSDTSINSDPLGLGFNSPLSMGLNGSSFGDPSTVKFAKAFPDGTVGGQCGVFAHQLVTFPNVGDTLTSKKNAVNKYGMLASDWQKDPQVGDVLISNDNPTTGHVAVVNAVLPGGYVQLSESNYGLKNKVTNNRIIAINSPSIYGAIRGTPKV